MSLPRQIFIVGLCSLSIIGTKALSQPDRSKPDLPRYTVVNDNPSAKYVLVWKDSKSHDRGLSLILNDVNKTHPEMIAALLACIVPNGTKVMLDSAGLFSYDITVIDGNDAGCQGNISPNDLQHAR